MTALPSRIIETIAIGDELLCGRTSDTNSTFVASRVAALGARLAHISVVADIDEDIREVLESRSKRATSILVFGGLGPTSDDRTAQVVAHWLGCELVENAEMRDRIEAVCRQRNRAVTAEILKQCRMPKDATPLPNPAGLAVGFRIRQGDCELFFLPGVPEEMRAMFDAHVFPVLEAECLGARLWVQRWSCLGIPESELQRQMSPLENRLPSTIRVGYQTQFPENHLFLYGQGTDAPPEHWERYCREVEERIGRWVYSRDDRSLEKVLLDELAQRNQSLVLTESCTGGLIASRLTSIPGSSKTLWGSFVVYQNGAKDRMLGVRLARASDAVSAPCSRSLSENALKKSGATWSIAVTGYMGPTAEGDPEPAGTAYIAIRGPKDLEQRVQIPDLGRVKNRWGMSTHCLATLLDCVRRANA